MNTDTLKFKRWATTSKFGSSPADKSVSYTHLDVYKRQEYKNRGTLPKLECSERIAPFLDLENNRSESFNHTVRAIQKLIET